MDHLTSMAVFARVAEVGSFAAVAGELDLSPTMVANHVRALEHRLDARLIDRTTRRHDLTELGRAYLERCREVLSAIAASDRVGEALHAEPEGRLRVSAPVSFGALVARPLRRALMFAVASPAYVARHGAPSHPSDIREDHCLGFAAWGRDHAWRFVRGADAVKVQVRGRLNADNGQALLTAALCGAGVVVQSDALVSPSIGDGRLVRLVADWELPTRPVHVLRRPGPRPSAKVRSFIDLAVDRLGDR